jgi:predicted AlkP superfamily phosphohydrolase/phosphomutase
MRLVMLGIDAAEHTLIDSLIARGRMPTLARLRQRGTSGLLQSPADLYSGAVWPTFYTGQRPAWHGVYHHKLWQPHRMCCIMPDESTYRVRPFWERLGPKVRTCIADVPLVVGRPRAGNGVFLSGWAEHDTTPTQFAPAALRREIERRIGRRVMPPENFGAQNLAGLERLLGELQRATEQMQRLAMTLLQRESWQFACIVFGTAHRAGHYLWDTMQARDRDTGGAEQLARLTGCIERVYEAIDAALSELLSQIGAEARVIVFSLHGMGANPGWSEAVPELLKARQVALSRKVTRSGSLYTVRKALVGVARPVLQFVPPALTARLVPLWTARMFDWRSTREFPLPMDMTGLLRVNLRDRERDGIVAVADYEGLCDELERFFESLRDATSGQAIVSSIVRAYANTPAQAPHRRGQPDLIVRWREIRTHEIPVLSSSLLPSFRCEVPRWLASGRSGNHLPHGWFIAAGPGIAGNTACGIGDIVDLAPTARALLGLAPDEALQGSVLPLVAAA